jgi:hypothetical protein
MPHRTTKKKDDFLTGINKYGHVDRLTLGVTG